MGCGSTHGSASSGLTGGAPSRSGGRHLEGGAGVPSLSRGPGPGALAGTRPVARIRLRTFSAGGRSSCRASIFKHDHRAAAVVQCKPSPSGRLGLWLIGPAGASRFMGFPLSGANRLLTVVPLDNFARAAKLVLARVPPGHKRPGAAVAAGDLPRLR